MLFNNYSCLLNSIKDIKKFIFTSTKNRLNRYITT